MKAENILITESGLIKISDFGLSSFIEPSSHLDFTLQMTGPNLNHTTCGTMNYIAPELIENNGYDGQIADIWSVGVILFYMLTGRKPFENRQRDI